jgi:alkylation response protein AidB-like acyl-CoA dehydrogenase
MDFRFSEEEQLLRDMVGEFIEREYTFEKRRAVIESEDGWSRSIWAQLAELGLVGINIAEVDGGVDAGPVATMLVMNAVGAGLLLEPYLASAIIAPNVLRAVDNSAPSRELLPAIASGEAIVVVAHQEPDARHATYTRNGPIGLSTEARRHGAGFVIDGRKSVVGHAQAASALIVSARLTDDGSLALFHVPAGAPGLTLEVYRALDGAPAADVALAGVEVPESAMLAAAHDAETALECGYDRALAAICAEAVGAMEALIDLTCEYLRTREQFGRPIGRFQALQHRAADMLIHSEQAKSMSYLATLHSRTDDRHERQRVLSAAKVLIGRACRFVGQQAIQLHGGMGMTDELSVSHYFKRLTAIEMTLGDAETHLDRFVALERAAAARPR